MRIPIAFAALAGCALAGCTIIPAADPAQTRRSAQPMPGPAPMPAYTPAPNYAPPPNYAPTPPAAPPAPVYTPAPAYAPPRAQELPPEPSAPLTYAALGQTVSVGGPRVTPLAVLEDSRCAMNARCVWAGQVRLRLRIDSGTGGTVEVTSGKPITVADGTLELVEVRPDKVAGGSNHGAVKPAAYRFGFRFMGGY